MSFDILELLYAVKVCPLTLLDELLLNNDAIVGILDARMSKVKHTLCMQGRYYTSSSSASPRVSASPGPFSECMFQIPARLTCFIHPFLCKTHPATRQSKKRRHLIVKSSQ